MPVVKKFVMIKKEMIEDIICNGCGNSLKDDDVQDFHGLQDACVHGGYGAKLGDGVSYHFSLCEDCLNDMFNKFKIPPEVNNSIGDDNEYVPDFGNGIGLGFVDRD